MRSTVLLVLPLLAGPAFAQTPIPQIAPRAHWVASTIATQLPVQVRENQGAASNDRMYVFGGRDGNAGTTTHNFLYEFDGNAWTQRTADDAPGSPPRRGGCAVAWNFTSGKLVVFGGGSGSSAVPAVLYNDIWEWDPATNSWVNVTPPASVTSPSPRQFVSMAWEPATGGMLLFGGNSGVVEGDTWLFLGGVWIPVGIAGPGTPALRQQASLMTRTNPEFQDVLMVGGQGGGVHFLDTWRWNASTAAWNLITPTTSVIPPAVVANQGVYDPLRRRVVLQGGNGIPTAQIPGYNAQPSGWCGEFDCVSNEWFLYGGATPATSDPVIGKVSRYYAAFVPALGKIYKVSGQANTTAMAMATYEYQATPIATAVSSGAGCSGSNGPMTLVAQDAPWSGRAWQVTGDGFPPSSLGAGIVGFGAQNVAISSLHPAGGVGCNLLVTTETTMLLLPIGSQATMSLSIPSGPAFVGAALRAQMLCIELNPGISALTSTNVVTGTIGEI
jgi:hypothetical protein